MANTETRIPLREHFERILNEQEKALILRTNTLERQLGTIVNELDEVRKFMWKLMGIGIVMCLVAGVLGAVIGHTFFK